jgi:hypothetical protein
MDELPDLAITPEKVCAILSMARQFDAKDVVTEPDPDSNATDDGGRAILEDHPDDPVRQELVTFIKDLDVDEQIELVTLMRLGRGDADIDDWNALREETSQLHTSKAALDLLEIPLLSDYLEEALSQFGESCEGLDAERL